MYNKYREVITVGMYNKHRDVITAGMEYLKGCNEPFLRSPMPGLCT